MNGIPLARARAAQAKIEKKYPHFRPDLLAPTPETRIRLAKLVMSHEDFIRWGSLDETIRELSKMG